MTATFFEEKSFYSPCSNFVAILLFTTKCLNITTNLFDDFCLYHTQCNNCRKGRSNTAENYLRHIFSKKIYHKCRMSHLLTILATIPRHSGGQEGLFSKRCYFSEFSQNLKSCEDSSGSITSLVCTALVGSLHNLWCGLLLYPRNWQCESQRIG